MSEQSPASDSPPELGVRRAFLLGLRRAPSTAAFVLICSFVGFGALAHESGVGLALTLGMSLFIWALPGQVVLVSEMAVGAAMWSAALSVTVTAIRLMPMTVVLMPILRTENTGKLHQILLAHFCAVTVWVESMQRLQPIARRDRIPYYWGFCSFLVGTNLLATIVGHQLAAGLGVLLSAALLFLTPLYFALSMVRALRLPPERMAMLFGFLLGPVLFVVAPGFELMLSGLIGGTLAYFAGRFWFKEPGA